ncbi:Filamentous hemagglutinin,Peptidase C65 Otubain [Chlamydia poikilotherma]|uniref:Filamentous hemagglutinin,Peptidase C65 Otubain n=1 Tax=Chlamydia poikilotherma TaxID=1967783 RepID=A0A3B0PRW8_9CHLA|nr:hypothetical protein [Chlamydia poikilotherma]SYX08751.1 Filamentous hemagglutinin,Peptidase C65 Otubain [Chlamydia poikilotherma]
MSSPSSTPPSCPPPGRNNLYHLQTNPQDPLCIRALRLVAYVLLHIITLGLLLLFHYCTNHAIEETSIPVIPVQPQTPTPHPTASPVSPRRSPTPQPQQPSVTQTSPDLPHPTTPTPGQQPVSPTPQTPVQPADTTPQAAPTPPITKASLDLPPTTPTPGQRPVSPAPQTPVQPVDTTPPTVPPAGPPVATPAPTLRSIPGLPTLTEIVDRMQRLGVLPSGVDRKSLEAMANFNEQGLAPNSARLTITATQILNPLFVATYPKRIQSNFEIMIRDLENIIRTGSPQSENTQVANLLLNQLKHLDANYYLVDVPGDGNCFYRSFYIGWLCSLSRRGNPQAFENEAQRILGLPFAQSSIRNQLLSEQMAQIIRSCQGHPNIKDLYDHILLSPIHTPVAISYLKNLALFTMDENRITSMGGAENVRALILGQMVEAPEMLADSLRKIIQTEPSSPILNHIFRGNMLPITGAAKQVELTLEFLSQLLLNDQDIQQLPQAQQQEAVRFQASLNELMNSMTAILVSGNLTEESVRSLIQNLPPEIQGHYQKFFQAVATTRPNIHLPTPLILVSFLLSHPSCAANNNLCSDFLGQAKTVFEGVLGNDTTLAEFLGWNGGKAAALNAKLQASWSQKQAGSLIEVALALCDGFKSSQTIVQLGLTYRIIAKLMQSTLQTLPEAQLRTTLDTILRHINQSANLTASYFEMSASPIFAGLELETSRNSQDKTYAEGIKMFFFLLQYPSLLQNRATGNAAKQIMLLYQPHLQQALRKSINAHRVLSTGGSIFGTFCWFGPTFGNDVNTQTIETTLSFLARDPTALSLCQTMRNDFFQIMDSGNPARVSALIQDVQVNYPELWENFIQHLDIVGYRATPQNATRPFSQTLTPDILLYSFLHSHHHILDNITGLTTKLTAYINEQTTRMKTRIVSNFDRWTVLFWANFEKITTYNNLQRAFLFSLVRRGNAYPEASQSFIHDLNTMDIRNLMRMFNSVNTQAEDEHISAISSALGSLALCQYLADGSLTQTVRQLTPLANSYGFFQMDYTPEQQAEIFVLRANNHYNCLLPKDANDTTRAGNSGNP